jgi:hypothetical protein
MGQEIVHCSTCGLRLRSSDFDKGDALKVEFTAYCRNCAPAGAVPDARSPGSDSSLKKVGSTQRIPVATPRRHSEAVPEKSTAPVLIWGGVGLVLAIVAAALLLTKPREQPAGPPPRVAAPAPEPRKTSAATPGPEKAPVVEKGPTPPAAPGPELSPPLVSAELSAIDAKVAEACAQGRQPEALLLLGEAKSRHDTLEWTAAIQSRIHELEKKLQPKPQTPVVKAPDPAAAPATAAAPTPTPASAPAPAPAPPAGIGTLIPFVPGVPKWSVLTPLRMSTTGGAVLTALQDGSILASGTNPKQACYSVVVQTNLKGITGFRLEVLPDPSLPNAGPGRSGNGNLVLSEFRVQVLADPQAASGTPIVLEKPAADFSQESWSISGVLDGKNNTGWAIFPAFGTAHEAAFEAKAPVAGSDSTTLLIVLDHQSTCDEHNIGRFRLSASTAKSPAQEIATRPPPPPPVIDPTRVDQAIQRGIAWLRNPPNPPPKDND